MTIEYASVEMYKSFSETVNAVCREGIYLASTTGFKDEQAKAFVEIIVANNYSQFFAIVDDSVVGWCDIIPKEQDLHKHVGVLGMGIRKEYRSLGIGTKLIESSIRHAKAHGIERIELEVYAGNTVAINLYEKFGFEKEGLKRKGKKANNEYEDILIMGLI